ncbi:MAG: ATP-binding protein, partial [Deltaproteobacteria bacterium]|nr:ATP-binding protein [Deltaproteobacteria bacterium]
LLDRIDIQIEVPPVKYGELVALQEGESSDKIRDRVLKARKVQEIRLKGTKIRTNGQMSSRLLRRFCLLDPQGSRLMEQAVEKMGLSARAYDRILKVSRTIADLSEQENIQSSHIAEAIHYRSLDRETRREPY